NCGFNLAGDGRSHLLDKDIRAVDEVSINHALHRHSHGGTADIRVIPEMGARFVCTVDTDDDTVDLDFKRGYGISCECEVGEECPNTLRTWYVASTWYL